MARDCGYRDHGTGLRLWGSRDRCKITRDGSSQDGISERITGQDQRSGSHAGWEGLRKKGLHVPGSQGAKVELDHAERGKDKKFKGFQRNCTYLNRSCQSVSRDQMSGDRSLTHYASRDFIDSDLTDVLLL